MSKRKFLDFRDYADSYAIPMSEGGKFHVDKYVDDYGMGSWLAGAGEGALGGAALGPWGAAAGAAIGLAKGIIGDVGANKQKKAQEDAQRQQQMQAIGADRLSQYSNQTYLPTFADGGDLKPDQVYQKREQYINKINKPLKKGKEFFTVNDLQNGKPGVRHGTKVDKNVLNALATAAAREKVPLMDALSTAMRETGLGYHSKAYTPKDIMQAHSSDFIPGIPQDYDQWRMKNNRVDKKYVSKDRSGYLIDMAEPDESKLKHLGDYNKYLDTFKYDPSLAEPFRKEMRFLKSNTGKAYNPGEQDRLSKIAREKQVIMKNKDLYHYADSVYKANTKKFALGGDINQASDLKGYGYNLMAAGGHMPEGNSTLAEAKEFIKLYPKEMAYGTKTEYEHTGNKKLAQRIAADHVKDSIKMNKGGEPDYYKRLQEVGISDELNKLPVMKSGGKLSVDKAKEMLRDGKVHGKPLTDRQKRYFGFIAGGGIPKKAVGGPLDSHDTPVARYDNILNSLENRNYNVGGYFGTAYSVSGGNKDADTFNKKSFTAYEGGGTHEQSSLGGIPIGDKARVEEGEVRVDFDGEGSYIFSNRF